MRVLLGLIVILITRCNFYFILFIIVFSVLTGHGIVTQSTQYSALSPEA